MSRIDKMIARICPDGVEYKKLGEVMCSTKKGTLKRDELDDSGAYLVVNGGREFYGRYSDFNNEPDTITVSARGDAGHVKIMSERFWAGGLCYPYVVRDENVLLPHFAFHWLKLRETWIKETLVAYGSIPALNKKDLDAVEIPVPPLDVQRETVRALDSIMDLEAELKKELDARKVQYVHYRDELLSRESLETMAGGEVVSTEIEAVCRHICSGGTPSTKNSDYFDGGDIPWVRTQDVDYCVIEDSSAHITEDGLANSAAKWIPSGCVIVAMYGATAAKVAMNSVPVTTNQACCNLEIDEDIALPRYVYHWLACHYEDLKALGEGSQSNISGRKVRHFPVILPPLSVQQQVVDILDRFDALTTSLTDGLPAEIKARRQQYEHYRDRLLDFPHKEMA